MKTLLVTLFAFYVGTTLAADLQTERIWNEVWDKYLIPPCIPLDCGMAKAKQEFSFMNDPYSFEYQTFIIAAGKKVKTDYDYFSREDWAYAMASDIARSFKESGDDLNARSAFAVDYVDESTGENSELMQVIASVDWMWDPTNYVYASFFAFADRFGAGDQPLCVVMKAFYKSLRDFQEADNSTQVSQTTQQSADVMPIAHSNPADTLPPIGTRSEREDAARAERRVLANENNKDRAAAWKAQREREREAAATAPKVNVQVHVSP